MIYSASLDVGLYPLEATDLVSKEWLAGKSGFKAIQYMSVGIPFVVTPAGVCAEIGIENETHFSASNQKQWYKSLAKLLESPEKRKEMGEKGRDYALAHFTVERQTDKIAEILQQSVEKFRRA
jgi:glycosyltransferase involved in cell wall biosynthesis